MTMARPTYHELATSWEVFLLSKCPELGLFKHEYNILSYEQIIAYLVDFWGPEDGWEDYEDFEVVPK